MLARIGKSLLAAVLAAGLPFAAAAQMVPGATFGPLPEPQSRFNRGNYFLEKGTQSFRRGQLESALYRWDISAYRVTRSRSTTSGSCTSRAPA